MRQKQQAKRTLIVVPVKFASVYPKLSCVVTSPKPGINFVSLDKQEIINGIMREFEFKQKFLVLSVVCEIILK